MVFPILALAFGLMARYTIARAVIHLLWKAIVVAIVLTLLAIIAIPILLLFRGTYLKELLSRGSASRIPSP